MKMYEVILQSKTDSLIPITKDILEEKIKVLVYSDLMPEKSIYKPLMLMLFNDVDNEKYKFIKQLKKVTYITESVYHLYYGTNDFDEIVKALYCGACKVENNILSLANEKIRYSDEKRNREIKNEVYTLYITKGNFYHFYCESPIDVGRELHFSDYVQNDMYEIISCNVVKNPVNSNILMYNCLVDNINQNIDYNKSSYLLIYDKKYSSYRFKAGSYIVFKY